jgi:hypothetical protein
MFSTVSSFWRPLAFPLSLVQDLDRKKGNCLLFYFDLDVVKCHFPIVFYQMVLHCLKHTNKTKQKRILPILVSPGYVSLPAD